MLRLSLILIVLLFVYSPESQAIACQTNDYALKPGNCTQGQAYQACQSAIATGRARGLPVSVACASNGNPGYSGACGTTSNPTSQLTCNGDTGFFFNYVAGTTCASQTPITGFGNFYPANDGDQRCNNGCIQTVAEDADSFTLTNTGGLCAAETYGPSNCPANYAWSQQFKTCSPLPPDADGDGIPDSEDEWPTDPDRAADSDQDGVANGFDKFPNDPTEAFDSDNDGIGDNSDINDQDAINGKDLGAGNETNNTSTGGGSCNSPPVSTGEAITAQIAYQAWATRCAQEAGNEKLDAIKNAIQAQGSLDVTVNPTVNVTVEGSGGTGSTISGDVSGMSLDEGVTGVTGGSGNVQDNVIDDAEFDSSGFLGGDRSCPEFPVLDVMGATLDFNVPHLCTFFEIGASLVLLFAAVAGLRIIGSA